MLFKLNAKYFTALSVIQAQKKWLKIPNSIVKNIADVSKML